MMLLFLAGVLCAVMAWRRYYRTHWSRELTVEAEFLEPYVFAGEQSILVERIENRKRLPLPVLEVSFRVKKELQFCGGENAQVSDFTYKRDIFSLLGRQRITRRLPINCIRRGHYEIRSVHITAYSLLQEELYAQDVPADTELYVYAKRVDVSEVLSDYERMSGTVQCARRFYEDPFAFRGIREYTPLDPMKTINWKASAHTGGLMVNTFDATRTERVMIYLNVEDAGIIRHENLVEEAISVAAVLVQKLLAKGVEAGLAVNAAGGIYLTPTGKRAQQGTVERLLAMIDTQKNVVSYHEILTELPEDVMPVFISRNTSGVSADIENFLGKERQGIWVVPVGKAGEDVILKPRNLHICIRKVAGE